MQVYAAPLLGDAPKGGPFLLIAWPQRVKLLVYPTCRRSRAPTEWHKHRSFTLMTLRYESCSPVYFPTIAMRTGAVTSSTQLAKRSHLTMSGGDVNRVNPSCRWKILCRFCFLARASKGRTRSGKTHSLTVTVACLHLPLQIRQLQLRFLSLQQTIINRSKMVKETARNVVNRKVQV